MIPAIKFELYAEFPLLLRKKQLNVTSKSFSLIFYFKIMNDVSINVSYGKKLRIFILRKSCFLN